MTIFSEEERIRRIKEFNKSYSHIEKDKLALYTVAFLSKEKIEATFEKASVAIFKLFPKSFQLLGFPEYPDGRTIYYNIYNHCTLTKKWLGGNIKSGFFVTEKGEYILKDMWLVIGSGKDTKKQKDGKPKIVMRKEASFVKKLKESTAFKKYLESKPLQGAEIKNAFGLPSSADLELLKSYIKRYKSYAELLHDDTTISFIAKIGKIVNAE